MDRNHKQDQIDDLFARAVDLPPEERLALLDSAANGDASFLAEIQKLLAAHDKLTSDSDFLAAPTCLIAPAHSDGPAVSTGGHDEDHTSPHITRSDAVECTIPDKLPSRFKLKSILGKGGFGAVYLAYDELLRREVALKMPCVHGIVESELKQFVEEARTLAQLKHPGIVPVYDVQITDEGVTLIMEYLEGMSLQDRIKQRPIPRDEAIRAIIQIADAIQYAHEQGFVHRDLKPSNILFDRDGRPRIADFGLAIHDTQQRKHAGELSGTLPYMSPEQVRGETHRLDGRTDIWSIGVILYELLTGRRPFQGDTTSEICEEILNREPKPLRQIDGSIPAELDKVCLECLSKAVTGRLTTGGDLADRLRNFLSSTVQPAGAPAVASFLPFRQFMAKANIGGLGCGLTVTLASLLIVVSLALLRYSSKHENPAIPQDIVHDEPQTKRGGSEGQEHKSPNAPLVAKESPSSLTEPAERTPKYEGRHFPLAPQTGGDPITASNDAVKDDTAYDEMIAQKQARELERIRQQQADALRRAQLEILRNQRKNASQDATVKSLPVPRLPIFPGQAAELVSLTTKDGVQLKISYYPGIARRGTAQAKQTTPVVFLHDYRDSRAIFATLVQKLQARSKGEGDGPSFAAVTVDLRGHGESTKVANNTQVEQSAAKLNKEDLIAMASSDMDAVRGFLVQKNDEGELNLNKLCLVGSGMGASVAANWALTDWSYPPLAIGKQGQDVKAVVMISPHWTYNGLLMQGPMKSPALKEKVAWMIVYGDQDAKFQTDAMRINKQLERVHPATDDTGAKRTSGLTVLKLNTQLQGDSLLTQDGGSVEDQIVTFLTENVADMQHEWIGRRNRLP